VNKHLDFMQQTEKRSFNCLEIYPKGFDEENDDYKQGFNHAIACLLVHGYLVPDEVKN